MNKSKRYLWLDTALFVAAILIVASSLALDDHDSRLVVGDARVQIHAAAGLTLLAGSGLHLAWHWDWVKAAFKRAGRAKSRALRRRRTVDLGLVALLALVSLSGLLIWPMAGNLDHGNPLSATTGLGLTYSAWKHLHIWGAVLMVILLIVHLVQHGSWLAAMARRREANGQGSYLN